MTDYNIYDLGYNKNISRYSPIENQERKNFFEGGVSLGNLGSLSDGRYIEGAVGEIESNIDDINVDIGDVTNQTVCGVPGGLSVSETGITIADDGTISAYVILTWDANTEDNFDSYYLRYKKNSFTYYTYIGTKETTITIDGLTPNTSYNFGISSVNKYGIQSNFSAIVSETTATSTTPPATVTGVSATSGIQYVIVEWTSNSESDIASYNIYRHTSDSSGDASLIANVKGNYIIDGEKTGGTEYFYWIKAVNTSGLLSEAFSTVVSATPRNVASADNQISNTGWTQDCVFSSTNNTIVEWTSGTFTTSAGTSYNILAGNTGAMAARTYIYLDIEVSTTEYQTTTTATNSVGDNRVLIGVAENNTGGAIFQVFGGVGGVFLDGGDIVTASITTDQIAANTIVAGNISAGTITATEIDTTSITSLSNLSIAASQVLIDGTVYLSNWRKTGDVTKIDGGEISANTITTTQLNFTPVDSDNVIATINASEEGITIDADNIEISGSTTFSSGYDPSDKLDELGGSYNSAASGARVRIFPDANTGLQVIDDGGNDVFKTTIGGTHIGDVVIGDYSGGEGMFYDKSEGTTTFAGNITGSTITGGLFRTGIEGLFFEMSSNTSNYLNFYDGDVNFGFLSATRFVYEEVLQQRFVSLQADDYDEDSGTGYTFGFYATIGYHDDPHLHTTSLNASGGKIRVFGNNDDELRAEMILNPISDAEYLRIDEGEGVKTDQSFSFYRDVSGTDTLWGKISTSSTAFRIIGEENDIQLSAEDNIQLVSGSGNSVIIGLNSSGVTAQTHIIPGDSVTSGNIGSSDNRFNTIYLQSSPDVSSCINTKENIRELHYGLEDILKLRPVEYNRKNEIERKNPDKRNVHLGLIKEEVELVLPEITSKKGYTPEEVIPVLIKSIQELNKKVEKLEKK